MPSGEFRFDANSRDALAGILGNDSRVSELEVGVNAWLLYLDAAPALGPGGKSDLLAGLKRTVRALAELDAALDGCGGAVREAVAEMMAARGDFGEHGIDPARWSTGIVEFVESRREDGRLPFETVLHRMRTAVDHLVALDWRGRPRETLRRELVLWVVSALDACGVPLTRGRAGSETMAERAVEIVLQAVSEHTEGMFVPGDVGDLLTQGVADLAEAKSGLNLQEE